MKLTPLIALIIFSASQAFAETSKLEAIVGVQSDMLSQSFKMVWGLLIVLGIILLLYGLLKKRFSLLATSADKEITIKEIKPLMGKKALCLVEVRGKQLLLGISDSQITHLATLDEKNDESFSKVLQRETGELHE